MSVKTKGKLGWLFVLLPLLLLAGSPAAAASPAGKGLDGGRAPAPVSQLSDEERGDKLKQLETAAEALYGHMQQGRVEEAHAEMERLIAALEGVSFKGLTSVEGIHALAESIMDARETLARSEIVPDEWSRSSAVLRLAVNSLLHKDKGLWLQYYKVMADDMQRMNNARVGGNRRSCARRLGICSSITRRSARPPSFAAIHPRSTGLIRGCLTPNGLAMTNRWTKRRLWRRFARGKAR